MKKCILILFLFLSAHVYAQTKQIENWIVFYTPQINSANTGYMFLDGIIKVSLFDNDTCLIQYSSHRLNKIKSIVLINDLSIISKIDSINSDVVSDSKKTKYKRLNISGKLNYSGKRKTFIINANNKKVYRKIEMYTLNSITITANCYKLTCGN